MILEEMWKIFRSWNKESSFDPIGCYVYFVIE